MNLRDGDELVRVIVTGGNDDIFMVSRKGMTIRFNEEDVRPMGRAAAGVRGMKLRPDDEVVSVDVARDDVSILIVTESGYGKRTQLERFNVQNRGGQGVIGMKLTARKGYVDGMRLSNGEARPGVGGGICQLANLVHWMVLHSPLTVTERSEHSFDTFPELI